MPDTTKVAASNILEFANAATINFTTKNFPGKMQNLADLTRFKLSEDDFSLFSDVLYQPETKRHQTLFLSDLTLTEERIYLDMCKIDTDLLVIHLPYLASVNTSLYFDIKVPANLHKQIVILEHADLTNCSCPKDGCACRQKQEFALKPTVFFKVKVDRDAKLDMVLVYSQLFSQEHGENNHNVTSGTAVSATVGTSGTATIQSRPGKPTSVETICLYRADVENNAVFNWTALNFANTLKEFGLINLLGEHSEANVNTGAYILSGNEQSFLTKINCLKPYANAQILNRGVVEGNGVGRMAAICDITKGARQSKVRQENRFITLSDKAKAFADPTLLIDEYDVSASHLATVGQLDAESTFYLCSRGLTKKQAVRLATIGFLTPIVDSVPQPSLRKVLMAKLTATVNEDRSEA